MRTIKEIQAELDRDIKSLPNLTAKTATIKSIEIKTIELLGTIVYQTGIPLDQLEKLCEGWKDGRCVVLSCKAGELMARYNKLTEPTGDEVETYTTGYRNGYRNGQAELIAHLLKIDTGIREEGDAALAGQEGGGK